MLFQITYPIANQVYFHTFLSSYAEFSLIEQAIKTLSSECQKARIRHFTERDFCKKISFPHWKNRARTWSYRRWNLDITTFFLLLSSLFLRIDWTENLDQFLHNSIHMQFFFTLMYSRVLRYNQKNNILIFLGLSGSDFMVNAKQFAGVFVHTSGEFGNHYQKQCLQFCSEFNAFLVSLYLKHPC